MMPNDPRVAEMIRLTLRIALCYTGISDTEWRGGSNPALVPMWNELLDLAKSFERPSQADLEILKTYLGGHRKPADDNLQSILERVEKGEWHLPSSLTLMFALRALIQLHQILVPQHVVIWAAERFRMS